MRAEEITVTLVLLLFISLQATENTLSLQVRLFFSEALFKVFQYILNEDNTVYDEVVILPWGQM